MIKIPASPHLRIYVLYSQNFMHFVVYEVYVRSGRVSTISRIYGGSLLDSSPTAGIGRKLCADFWSLFRESAQVWVAKKHT